MKGNLVKFNDDGTQCKNDINYLRNHPECGVPFIEDKPFTPVKPPVKPPIPVKPVPIIPVKPVNPPQKFNPYKRDFNINTFEPIEDKPEISQAPTIGSPAKIGKVIRLGVEQVLPQDFTNFQETGRRLGIENLQNKTIPSMEFLIPKIGNTAYSRAPTQEITAPEPLGEIELEDFGAGVGIQNEEPRSILRSTRIRPLPDPRDTEFNITDLPPDIKENIISKTQEEKLNITDLPEEILERMISETGQVPSKIDVERLKNDLIELENLVQENQEEYNLSRNLMTQNLNDGNDELNEVLMRFMVNHNLNERNVINLRNQIKQYQRERTQRRVLSSRRPNLLKPNTQRRLLSPRRPNLLKPRGMTDEELIDLQIQQLTRNSTDEEAKQIERNLRSKGKGKAKIKPSEQEMFPISAVDEYKLVADEVDKILGKEETLTIKQKENLLKEMQSRGISKERFEEILQEASVYDEVFEKELGGSKKPQVERLARLLQRGLRSIPTRDTNLLPESSNFEIEVREDTPLTRGRVNLNTGRSRVEKVYDKVAGKLPEELRTLAGSVKRNAEEFSKNITTKSLEAKQTISANKTKVFGQKYSKIIKEVELSNTIRPQEINAPEGNINIQVPKTEDITGIRPNDLEAIEFNVLGSAYAESFNVSRPKLTYAQRFKRGMISREAGIGGVGAVGGIATGFLTAKAMADAGIDNTALIGASSGAVGGMTSRILTMAGTRMLTRTSVEVGTETLARVALRSGTSILRGGLEGGVIGVVLMPLDIALNNVFVNSGMSHLGANLTSGTLIGGTATALTTIGLASLGSAPETLGASLVVGAIAMGITSIIGGITGANQDAEEEKQRQEVATLKSTAKARKRLLQTLPNFDYDYRKAYEAFVDKSSLGLTEDNWASFNTSSADLFTARPKSKTTPDTGGNTGEQSDDDKKVNRLITQYVKHTLINKACGSDNDCTSLKQHDKGALTDEETEFLNDKTASTWKEQSDMQVEMSFQELNYTRHRIANAQSQMLTAWSNKQQVANDLDPYIVETAYLDKSFREKYELALKLDAQQQVVDAYQQGQTKLDRLPKNIRDMANLDPDFDAEIHRYYTAIEQTSEDLDVTIPQLIQLQGLEGKEQTNTYKQMQFDNLKQNENVVDEAKEVATEDDAIRKAEFYDIDQAFMETDPTRISTWHPTDSQILQAHSAGMNLNEYVAFMHQLALGKDGDFSKLPQYSDDIKLISGLEDFTHFQDELQLAGYRKDLYLYDPQTRDFTLNPNVTNSAIPSTQNKFISRYTPKYLSKARTEYADMIHGLNEENQNAVNNYNTKLMKELSSYGKHYDSIVADINNERLYEGRTDLLYYHVQDIYDNNKLEFNALSDKLQSSNQLKSSNNNRRQLIPNNQQQVNIKEKYVLDDNEYDAVKNDLTSKNITAPTESQMYQAVQEVKTSTASAPPMAS